MARCGGVALALLLAVIPHATAQRSVLFDKDWKFFRGDVDVSSPAVHCPASDFPSQVGRCMGLKKVDGITSPDSCRDACCTKGPKCTTWQWCAVGSKCNMANQCWIGSQDDCAEDDEGWVTAARDPAPGPAPPPPPPGPPPTFAKASFDDSSWRTVELPHDWSIEDLPAREDDIDTPAITIRNGTWKFSKGEGDESWAAVGFDDSKWTDVTVPSNWRDPPLSYTDANATGWYRRSFTLPADKLAAYHKTASPVMLALGEVACSDITYVNGKHVGGTSGCIPYRAYALDLGGLKAGENVVAVKVSSFGKPVGGLCDAGGTAKNGVSVATGSDWQPPSPFDPARSPNGRSYGYSVDGAAWYRKNFSHTTSHLVPNERVSIRFDGVYMNSDMYLNGVFIGNHPYGYTAFQYDLTPHLVVGNNVLAVRVRDLGRNSRWYSGSGMFRHTHLITTPEVHIGLWGVVTRTQVAHDKSSATVSVSVVCENNGTAAAPKPGLTATIMDASGQTVAKGTANVPPLAAGGSTTVKMPPMVVKSPKLWDIDSPENMYSVKVDLSAEKGAPPGATQDTEVVPFGIREISFTADDGFQLNGKKINLQGGCVHHDNGPLGSATIGRAEERRVENLKKLGYNAIRTSHNPVSPAFLDACDRLGVLVMHEAFDCFEQGKNTNDYHVYFDAWWRRDLATMVKRSQNHPSIVMWSIGNEIPMRETAKGTRLYHELADAVRAIDPTRYVTSAIPMVKDADEPDYAALDVGGYNYSPRRYDVDHAKYPDRVMVGTESFPMSSFEMWDHIWNSSWVVGDFIWTSIDYIGESAIGSAATTPDLQAIEGQPWNWHISFCGDIDIVGKQKAQSFYRTVLWGVSTVEMAVHRPMIVSQKEKVSGWGWPDEMQSWTWPGHEGESLAVRVFARCASGQVDLKLNGKAVATSPQPCSYATEFIAEYNVPYAPGTLTASCVGNATATKTFTTAKKAASIVLSADRSAIMADRDDLSYVTASIVDADGTLLPDARVDLDFVVSGDGELSAVGTGDPTDVSSFHSGKRTTWHGVAVAILRPTTTDAGSIKLTVSAAGLKSASVTVSTTVPPS